jgi:hypothetical protein
MLLIEQMLTRQVARPTIPTLRHHSPMIGETISHYRIIQKIGAGGVYRAHDDLLKRDVVGVDRVLRCMDLLTPPQLPEKWGARTSDIQRDGSQHFGWFLFYVRPAI